MRLPDARQIFAVTAAASALMMTAACGSDSGEAAEPTGTTQSSTPAGSTDGSSSVSGDYADGTYEGTGDYINPGGVSSVDVTLTLSGGTVESVDVQPGAQGESLMYQQKFISGIADEVVGKSLDEISVSKVSGSSLTSQGFNKALEQIKAEASA